ncbi:CUB domain-containing protein-like isoform X3 [Acropora muricata]
MTYLKYHIEENRGIPAESGQVKMKAFLLSLATLLACIVFTESAPHSAEIREAFEEQVRNDLQAVQRDFHLKNLTCAECQGNNGRNCTLGERQVQCNPGEVCTTLEAFNLDTLTTTVTRGCFDLTGLNCDDNPGCDALNTTGNIQSCDQLCCTISLCNAGTLTTVTPQTTEAPTTSPTTLAPTTPFFCDAILGQSGTFTSPNFPADYPNGVTCVAVANIPANRQMRFSVDFIQLGDPGCKCGNCNVALLQNISESYCCCELEGCKESMKSDLVRQDLAPDVTLTCITEHPGFQPVCLQKWSLRLAADKFKTKGKKRYRQTGSEESFLRSVAYREFSRLVYGLLGKKRAPLPACAYTAIRKAFTVSEEDEFTGFVLDEEN